MFKKLQLRRAKKRDVKKIVKLFSLVNQKTDHKTLLEQIEEKKVYILKHKKKITAAFSYTLIGVAGFFAIMYISKIAVDPELQGKGIGSLLMSRIRKTSIKIGASAIFLVSLKTAKQFYEKNKLSGFWRFFWWRKKA